MPRGKEFFRGLKLTGVKNLKNSHNGQSALILCSGPTFAQFSDLSVPRSITRIAINETIQRLGDAADYWILSDILTAEKYGRFCPPKTKVITVHRACEVIDQHCPKHEIFTVQSMDRIEDFNDGYRFFSRRTVMIAAVELGRYLGFKNFYCFGLDLFRTHGKYYYDGTEANYMSEKSCSAQFEVRNKRFKGEKIYQTPNLRAASAMLDRVKKAGLWNGVQVFCVNSPVSCQDAVPKMEMQDFLSIVGTGGSYEAQKEVESVITQPPKRRGRPPGSKNKPKDPNAPPWEPKPRGRPPGSKNKPKVDDVESTGIGQATNGERGVQDENVR